MASSQLPSPSSPSPTLATSNIEGDEHWSENRKKWYFDKTELLNTPSSKVGITTQKEMDYRREAACFIQEMGVFLNLNQLCINTAIIYMNRFYMIHPFTVFHPKSISIAAMFLASKVEEQPKQLYKVVRFVHGRDLRLRNQKPIVDLDPESELCIKMCREVVADEDVLLQTLGFDLAIDHSQTHVLRWCPLFKASRSFIQVAFDVTKSMLYLTTMCLQYRPTFQAALAIHLASIRTGWQVPHSANGKKWWNFVDAECTFTELENVAQEYFDIYNNSPQKFKFKVPSLSAAKGIGGSIGEGSSTSLGATPAAISSSTRSSSSSQPVSDNSRVSNLNMPNESSANRNKRARSRSRSPSPKRQKILKLNDAQKPHRPSSSIPSGSSSSSRTHLYTYKSSSKLPIVG